MYLLTRENEGKNKNIINRCKKLAEYGIFITKIHEFWEQPGSLEEAIKEAINYCSSHGILKEYLEIYGAEVLNMILNEWNTEDAIAFAREEGREEIARNALAKGISIELIHDLTGISIEAIQEMVKNR